MIDAWMPTLKAKLAEISGLQAVYPYNELPASLMNMPCAVITTGSGDFSYGLGEPALGEHEVQITIYTSAQILPEAHNVAAGFIGPVRNKLAANIKLGGTVVKILPSPDRPTYEGPGQIPYADKTHIGVAFHYRVYENETGAYTVSA